jgi:hypothetical protein
MRWRTAGLTHMIVFDLQRTQKERAKRKHFEEFICCSLRNCKRVFRLALKVTYSDTVILEVDDLEFARNLFRAESHAEKIREREYWRNEKSGPAWLGLSR